MLAACTFTGSPGLFVGVWWPLIGIAAAIGLVLYFLGAVVSHLRVGDIKGIGPTAFMLVGSCHRTTRASRPDDVNRKSLTFVPLRSSQRQCYFVALCAERR